MSEPEQTVIFTCLADGFVSGDAGSYPDARAELEVSEGRVILAIIPADGEAASAEVVLVPDQARALAQAILAMLDGD